MDAASRKAGELRQQISKAEKELEDLRRQLRDLEATVEIQEAPTINNNGTIQETIFEPPEASQLTNGTAAPAPAPVPAPAPTAKPWPWPLAEEEYERYARQLILPGFGTAAQLRLRSASVLIVGAGGLGCPAALYLCGAGVGALGIIDGDAVEASNLHRQVGHSAGGIGAPKAESLAARCRALNPLVRCAAHAGGREPLAPRNAADVVRAYDVVLDCTDRPASRYLVSDACVLLGKPLVSASALRTDGQLIVLNNPPSAAAAARRGDQDGGERGDGEVGDEGAGPCYRCIFPRPPPAESVLSCGEGGILGPVVGVMGVLQALEAIKLIVNSPSPGGDGGDTSATNSVEEKKKPAPPSLLLFSAHSSPPTFRSVRMRGRRPDCFACSPRSTLTLDQLTSGSLDYLQFCGVNTPLRVLRPEERVSAAEYDKVRAGKVGQKHLLLDVREKEHYSVASIPGSINVPFSKFQALNRSGAVTNGGEQPRPDWMPESLPPDAPIYVVCRVGNDSQLVTRSLKEMGLDQHGARFIGDIKGGMRAWKQEVDHTIPFT